MKDVVRNFIVGLTSIIALAGIVLLLFWFGELDAILRQRYMLTLHTDNALGLRPGSITELNGVPIGVVDNIIIQPNQTYPVQIEVLIERGIPLPTTVEPYAETSLLGASAILYLSTTPAPEDETVELFSTDDTASITGPLRIRMIEQITAELDARMKPVMDTLATFETLSATYIELGENLNALVSEPGEDVPEEEKPANLRDTVDKLNKVLDEVNVAMQLAERWLGDEQLHHDARTAVKNASELIVRATTTVERYSKLADTIETDADQLLQHLLPVADEFAVVLEDIHQLSQKAKEGEGTVAQMLNNPDLYNSLEDAAQRLEQTLREIQLLVEKIKAEGVTVDL